MIGRAVADRLTAAGRSVLRTTRDGAEGTLALNLSDNVLLVESAGRRLDRVPLRGCHFSGEVQAESCRHATDQCRRHATAG